MGAFVIGGVQWLGDGAKTREADRSAIEDFDGCSTYCPLVIGALLFMVYSTVSWVNRGWNTNRERSHGK